MEKKFRIGFIGSGNMGTAIMKGILDNALVSSEDIIISDISLEKLQSLKQEYHINITSNNTDVIKGSDIIILAVKPNICPIVLEEIDEFLLPDKILISIVAGWTTEALKLKIHEGTKILRVMPNTPALVGEGMTVFSKGHNLHQEEISFAEGIFSSLGTVLYAEEKWMDIVTAISGSGPAYVFMFIEALADAGVLQGLPRDISYKLAAQMVLGSAKMVLETGKHPGELKDNVCSPGGTTIEAVYTLEQKGFRGAVMEAVLSCADKSKKLSNVK